ncbi:MAG: hypothetical protein ACRC9Z_06960 [Weissella confusa]
MSKLLYLLSDSDLSDRVLSVLDENGFRIEDVVTKTGKSLFPDEHSVRSYNKVRKVSLDKPLLQRVFSKGTKDLLLYALMLDLRTDFSLPCKLIAEEHFLYDSIFTRI